MKQKHYEMVSRKIDGMVAVNEKYRLIVRHDEDVESPREWGNVGKMVCWHGRMNLGDKRDNPKDDVNDWALRLANQLDDAFEYGEYSKEELEKAWEIINKHCVILPLYVYEHGGITMSTGKFSCPWDSGQVGWIYCTLEKGRKEWPKDEDPLYETAIIEKITKHLQSEVEIYDHYIQGNCWQFQLQKHGSDEGEFIEEDSCGGFIGDVKECGIRDHLCKEAQCLVDELEWN
jgi:hypothetical protein